MFFRSIRQSACWIRGDVHRLFHLPTWACSAEKDRNFDIFDTDDDDDESDYVNDSEVNNDSDNENNGDMSDAVDFNNNENNNAAVFKEGTYVKIVGGELLRIFWGINRRKSVMNL